MDDAGGDIDDDGGNEVDAGGDIDDDGGLLVVVSSSGKTVVSDPKYK